ncbi:MAG: hypothetical protein JW384_03014 [Nitrosomonadaceae bacterium]|nr:hypothetical protein [Nitrosomonadaceae bacterium]
MIIDRQTRIITLPGPPKKIKKITGTKISSILGISPWNTAFQIWCDMTGTYKEPFEDTKYTKAGKVIEPKVIAYLDKKYYFGRKLLKSPEEWYGKTVEQMRYDHFPQEQIFGGMWDARTDTAVYELKTTKRVEDWYMNGLFHPPEYYKVQAALMAFLLRVDEFRLVLTMPEEKDYEHPENFVPTPKNTLVKKYSLKAEYPFFIDKINECLHWHHTHIIGHTSPPWDEKKDKDIIKALTTAHVLPTPAGEDADIVTTLLQQIEPLQSKIDAVSSEIADAEKALEPLKKQLKAELESRMGDNDKKIEVTGTEYKVEVSRAAAGGVDTEKLKEDGLYEKYKKTGYTAKLTIGRKVI